MNQNPALRPTIPDLKKHPWFDGLDWNAVTNREIRPPRLGPGWTQEESSTTVDPDFEVDPELPWVVDKDLADGEEESKVDEFNFARKGSNDS
jgi:hypothetical protein